MRKKNIGCLLTVFCLTLFPGCQREEEDFDLELPPIPVLTIQTNWAVIQSNYLRLRETASLSSPSVALLRKGQVLEILSRTLEKETIDEEAGYWYQIDFDGLQGWVFGSYLALYDTRQKADRASRELP